MVDCLFEPFVRLVAFSVACGVPEVMLFDRCACKWPEYNVKMF